MSDQDISLAALAGLLHDIGKIAIRAGEAPLAGWDGRMQDNYVYKHALLTAEFVDKYVPAPWKAAVKLAAGNHHRPQPMSRLESVVMAANFLSAGEDDAKNGDEPDAKQPQQLLSIFCSVKQDGHSAEDAYLPLAPLKLHKETLFPKPALAQEEAGPAYSELWRGFLKNVERLQIAHADNGDLSIYIESMLHLMQRYTWCIPSAYYKTRPDVGLYDHSRVTAAIAAVLHKSSLSQAELQQLYTEPNTIDKPVALLVGGDISGIQDFIYTITARGATSALRGRSFYLQLLTEAVLRYTLRYLDLPITNVIYSGGGKFYLLAAPEQASCLPALQERISRILLQNHQGDLYLAVTAEPLQAADFFGEKLSAAWGKLNERFQQRKQQRFAELKDDLSWLFEPQGRGGDKETQCQVCGHEHPDIVKDLEAFVDGEPVRKCLQCRDYEELGDALRQAQYLALQEITASEPSLVNPPGHWRDILATFGLGAKISTNVDPMQPQSGQRSVIWALNDEALLTLQPTRLCAIGRRMLVNVTPILQKEERVELLQRGFAEEDLPKPGKVTPFDVLAAHANGIQRLGVLRMDVDNLGDLFATGLGAVANLSRIAALSFAVSVYFEGWVHVLAEQVEQKRRLSVKGVEKPWDRLYSIYSGGDDLFFVGAWDVVVELARSIRADLTPYAAHHPGIHASAGIALVTRKYPLYQAARDAGAAEEQAKQLRWRGEGDKLQRKDAIAFLGQALPWSQFGMEPCEAGMNTTHKLMHLLVKLMVDKQEEGGVAPKALVQRLIGFYQQYEDAMQRERLAGRDRSRDGAPQVLWGPWMWHAFYMLSRLHKRTNHDGVKELRDQLKADNFRSIDWVGLAARWADLWTRSDSQFTRITQDQEEIK